MNPPPGHGVASERHRHGEYDSTPRRRHRDRRHRVAPASSNPVAAAINGRLDASTCAGTLAAARDAHLESVRSTLRDLVIRAVDDIWVDLVERTVAEVWRAAESAVTPAPEASAAAREPAPDPPASFSGLTDRELDVLRLVAAGQTNREIAEALFISPKTAEHHVSSILMKLGVTKRAHAAALAGRHLQTPG